ncbi:hypothetical protein NDU88_001994 [Pleurodeles waltl]|uniref:Uncharacterized protein n=1 Tax=Pleurodeles waltl TaxID=8319 RepID=A0AAV7VD27_PLEWA|nr:hypothetical protein NDU88_001994 [Pleurodeles waltl]
MSAWHLSPRDLTRQLLSVGTILSHRLTPTTGPGWADDAIKTPCKKPANELTHDQPPSDTDPDPTPNGTVAIIAELKTGYKVIDSCFSSLTMCLGHMNKHIDHHATRLEGGNARSQR